MKIFSSKFTYCQFAEMSFLASVVDEIWHVFSAGFAEKTRGTFLLLHVVVRGRLRVAIPTGPTWPTETHLRRLEIHHEESAKTKTNTGYSM